VVLSRGVSRLVVGSLALALVGGGVTQWPAAMAAVTAPQVVVDDSARPDSVSAAVTARVTGHRVEDLSQRDEFTQVFANPDGTWTAETAAEPVSVQDSGGVWHGVDTTLVVRDGGLAPAYAVSDLVLSDGGESTFASLTEDGRRLDWRWPTSLPAPTVEGNTATYHDVLPEVDADLVVTATATGFTHDIVLNQAPTAPLEVTLPVATHGALLVEQQAGSVAVETKSGETLVAAPQPVMWDSSADAGGQPEVAVVDTTIGEIAGGTPTLTLSPDDGFLADPDTVYPVTIDPSYSNTVETSGDTWVQNADYTSSQSGSTELRAGTYDGGGHVARSFMRFNADGAWTNKHILTATLKLRNWYSGSCTGSAIRASRITEAWSTASISWSNQPTVGAMSGDYSPAKGYSSSCAGGDAAFDVAEMVQAWADDGSLNYGIRLKAVDETSNNTWRKYRSADYGDSTTIPRIAYTYNSYPNKPGTPTVTPTTVGYASKTPTFKATVSDPDLGTVRAKFEVFQGATSKWSGTTASPGVPSGSSASMAVPAPGLADGTYTVRAYSYDGTDYSAAYSTSAAFTVDTTKPATGVTATAFTNGGWTSPVPAANTFKFDGPTDTKSFTYWLDGEAQLVKLADTSGDLYFSWLPTKGSHTVAVKATDKAVNVAQTASTFTFGVGPAEFTTPAPDLRSTGVFPVAATGRPGATGVSLSWRHPGEVWHEATEVTKAGAAWLQDVTQGAAGSETGALMWDAGSESDLDSLTPEEPIAAPAHLELQACFDYTTAPLQVCSDPRPVQLVPSAFGGSFPVTNLGPATVALFTGEATISAGDAVDATAGVGRTFAAFDQATSQTGPFGPGWSSTMLAPGDTAAELVDSWTQDHTFVLVSPGGGSETFTPEDPTVDLATATGPVSFRPAGADDGSRLVWQPADPNASPATPAKVTLTRPGDVVTTWTQVGSDWQLVKASSPSSGTTFDYASGYVEWIAEVEPGTSPTCTATSQEIGCRGLKISYTGTGVDRRATQIQRLAAGATPVTVATYSYNGDNQLASVCGPDPDPSNTPAGIAAVPLCAGYAYNTTTVPGRTLLQQITPPGQEPWHFDYDPTGRLSTVTRTLDATTTPGAGPARWSVAYDLAPSTTGLPDLTAATAAQWGQTHVPTKAFATFGPEHPVTGTPTDQDLEYARVWFTDEAGATTNTAVHGNITPDGSGAGQWLVDTPWYDKYGNVTQYLDGAGYARVLAADPADRAQVADAASSYTVYNDDHNEDTTDGDGIRVEDEWGPVHEATLKDGTTAGFRAHTSYTCDEEDQSLGGGSKPAYDTANGETSFNLVVEARHSAASADRSTDFDTQVVRNEYDPVVAGDGNGWTLGTPTRVKVQLADGSWSVTVTCYNSDGNEVETRQPGGATNADGSGADAHATVFSYYAAGAADEECNVTGHPNRQTWLGLPCKTGPAGQPTGTTMPTTYNQVYDDDLQPIQVVETSGSTTRTTTASYDGLGRPTSTSVAVVGSGAETDAQSSTTAYDPATGLPTGVSNPDSSIVTEYDTWGRVKTYTDATGMTSGPTYTVDGLVAGFNDGAGVYAYGYDGPTGEHRRLPTSVDAGLGTGLPDVFTLGYDAHGAQSRVVYPNGMVASYTRDDLGVTTGLAYTDPGTSTTLLGFTNTVDVDGRVIAASSAASQQDYDYDNLGRLTRTQDVRGTECTTRTYGFSAASERTSFASYAPAVGGACQETTAAVAKTNTYDSANRIRNTGYGYDTLGRTLTTPAVDTAAGGLSDLTASYYASDMVKSLSQTVDNGTGGSTVKDTSYTLDATGRIATIVNKTDGAETDRLRYRFAGGSDSPSSIQTSIDDGATWGSSTRYVTVPGLGQVAAVIGTTTTIQVANLHRDVVATQQQTAGPLIIDSYAETDEHGNNIVTGTPNGRYRYLGVHQRSGDTVGGVSLMGARVYNPTTGLFLSSDPILGGGANRYSYPTDPVNMMDLDGHMWGWIYSAGMGVIKGALSVACGLLKVTGLVGVVCGAVVGAVLNVADYVGRAILVDHDSVDWDLAAQLAVQGAIEGGLGGALGHYAKYKIISAMRSTLRFVMSRLAWAVNRLGWGGLAAVLGTIQIEIDIALTGEIRRH
jgi:RHS repeat-associated protein